MKPKPSRKAKAPGKKNPPAIRVVWPGDGASVVSVAGSFNGWNPAVSPMHRRKDSAGWEIDLDLAPGIYEYLIVVDGNWCYDPENPRLVPNPYGGMNSVLVVKNE
jgi:1,4-alpha-glucan branching enzyme